MHTEYEPGCYVDGHWGWRAVSRFIELFSDDPSELRLAHAYSRGWTCANLPEVVYDIADDVLNRLNESIPPSLVAHWYDGELYISPTCANHPNSPNNNCHDDMCAAHAY